MGGLLCGIFGKDYIGIYDLEITHPETGQNLFAATHACGTGADVLSEGELLAEITDLELWSGYLDTAASIVNAQVADSFQSLLSLSAQVAFSDPEGVLNSINPENPTFSDLAAIDKGFENLEFSLAHTDYADAEEAAILTSLQSSVMAERLKLQAVIEGPEYSALLGVERGLQAAGVPQSEINKIMTPEEAPKVADPATLPQYRNFNSP